MKNAANPHLRVAFLARLQRGGCPDEQRCRYRIDLAQRLAQPPQQASYIRPQQAVVGVNLVEDDEPHAVVLEDVPAVTAHEHVFEHHVVGEQQVGWVLTKLRARDTLVSWGHPSDESRTSSSPACTARNETSVPASSLRMRPHWSLASAFIG